LSAKVFHIPLILTTPSFNLHSIVQRTPVPGNSAGEDHPTIKVLPSTDALFAESDVDIVVVTTTPDSHFALTKAALEAGKHVIVEKPFVPTAQEADALIAIASAHQKLICVYQNRRWDSDFLTFRKLHAEGTLGRIVEYETHFDRYKPDRPDSWKGQLGMENAGGVIYDLGSHLLDQAYVVFGLPKAVTGIFQNQRADGSAEPDSITVLLHYGAEGPLVTAKAGVISIESEQLRFWIRGTKGS
jgi:predicted dehydrogenase